MCGCWHTHGGQTTFQGLFSSSATVVRLAEQILVPTEASCQPWFEHPLKLFGKFIITFFFKSGGILWYCEQWVQTFTNVPSVFPEEHTNRCN